MTSTARPSTMSLPAVSNGWDSPAPEKNIDSSTIAPNSATVHDAMTSVPSRVET